MNSMTTEAPDAKIPTQSGSTRAQIRGSSLLLFGKLPTKGINFVVQLLTVHYLTKGDFGAFAYALSIATLIQTIVTFGLDRAVTRFIPIYHERGEYGRIFGTLLLVVGTIFLLSAATIALLYGGREMIGNTLIADPRALSLLLVVIFLAPLQALDETLVGMLAVFGAAGHIFVRKHVLAPLLKLAVILLVMFGNYSVFGLACGLLVSSVLGIAIYLKVLIRVLREQGVLQKMGFGQWKIPTREIFTFTIPLLTTDLLYVVINTMDAVMLESFFGNSEVVATLRVVQPAALMNQLVMTSFGVLFTPMAARLFSRNDTEGVNKYYWQTAVWVAVLSLPIFLLTFSCARPITLLLYGSRYEESAVIMALLSIGYYFNAALGFNGTTLKVYGKLKYIVAINVAGMLANLAGNYLLIPLYGPLGAAIATAGTLIVHNLLKQLGLKLGTGVNLFQWHYIRVYGFITAATLVVLLPQLIWSVPTVVSLILTGIVSLLVIRLSRNALNVQEAFPEILRIPLMRHLLGR